MSDTHANLLPFAQIIALLVDAHGFTDPPTQSCRLDGVILRGNEWGLGWGESFELAIYLDDPQSYGITHTCPETGHVTRAVGYGYDEIVEHLDAVESWAEAMLDDTSSEELRNALQLQALID